MEFCLLQDVFPNWKKDMEGPTEANISAGCTDMKSAERARKEQKKRAKKCKDPSLRYLEPDADRPSFANRVEEEVLPMNSKTGIVSGGEEGFQVQVTTLPKNLPGTNATPSQKTPSYFGASEDDDSEEGFASFTNIIGDNPAYKLMPDEVTLPTPSLDEAWKPLTPSGAPTAFFQYLKAPTAEYQRPPPTVAPTPSEHLSSKFDEIFKRLDQLESERRQSTQTEVLLFVGSGLVLLCSLDFLTRRA
jgi:hypothetical protein